VVLKVCPIFGLGRGAQLRDTSIFEFSRDVLEWNLRLNKELARVDRCKNLLFASLRFSDGYFITKAELEGLPFSF
jgi:hypothetical protein